MLFLPLKHTWPSYGMAGRWNSVVGSDAVPVRHLPKHLNCQSECPEVTKKEIVATIAEEIGLTQLKTKEIVQKTFDAIVETLVRDGRIELRNFGVFEVKRRAPRKARNPRTGDKVYVPAKNVVTFKPGKEMEERVRQMDPANLPVEGGEEEGAPEIEMASSSDSAANPKLSAGTQSSMGS